MSNPFADSSVKAAETSRSSASYSAAPTSSKNPKSASVSGGSSGAGGGGKSSYDKAIGEVTSNPMVQAAATSAFLTGAQAGLFDSKVPGLSSVASSSAAPQVKDGEIPTTIDCEPAELEEMKKWAAKLRITNIVVCTLLMLSCFFSLGSTDMTLVFISMYVFFFAMLLCCYELGLQVISQIIVQNFGFVYNTIPRRIFVVMVALLCFELGLIGKISMGVLLASECVHAYVLFKYPVFGYYMKLKHFYGVHDPTPRNNAVMDESV